MALRRGLRRTGRGCRHRRTAPASRRSATPRRRPSSPPPRRPRRPKAMAQSAAPVRSSARMSQRRPSQRRHVSGRRRATRTRPPGSRLRFRLDLAGRRTPRGPGGDDRDEDRRDHDAGGDQDRRRAGGIGIGRVGRGDDRRHGGGIAGRRGRGDARDAGAAGEPVGEEQRDAGDDHHGDAHGRDRAGPPARPCVRSRPAPSAKAKNGIITGIARLRKSRISRSRLPMIMPTSSGRIAPTSVCHGKGREAGDAERHHGEERPALQRHHGVGADVARAAVLAHQRHVEAAVGVVHRGDDGQGGEAREHAGGDRRLAEDLPEDEAEQDGDADLHDQQRAALLQDVGRRA